MSSHPTPHPHGLLDLRSQGSDRSVRAEVLCEPTSLEFSVLTANVCWFRRKGS